MTRSPRVVFPDCPTFMAEQYDEALRRMLPQLEIDIAAPSHDALVRRLSGCAALMHFRTRFTAEMMAASPQLRTIVFLGTGVGSWVDLGAAAARGISVRRILGYGDRAV